MPKPRAKKRGRIHLRVPEELEERMHDYVKRNNTTLSAVATSLFVQLLKTEEAQKAATAYDAEQV